MFFSVFNIVWTTFFLEVWKRNSATFAYTWGTIGIDDFEEARAAYHGELGRNKVRFDMAHDVINSHFKQHKHLTDVG